MKKLLKFFGYIPAEKRWPIWWTAFAVIATCAASLTRLVTFGIFVPAWALSVTEMKVRRDFKSASYQEGSARGGQTGFERQADRKVDGSTPLPSSI